MKYAIVAILLIVSTSIQAQYTDLQLEVRWCLMVQSDNREFCIPHMQGVPRPVVGDVIVHGVATFPAAGRYIVTSPALMEYLAGGSNEVIFHVLVEPWDIYKHRRGLR